MKKYWLLCSIPFIWNSLQAQDGYYADALRYSSTQFGGTSRMMGIGGAGSSLGADLGTVYYNPAGLGFYRKSDISFSPSLGAYSSNSTYAGNRVSDNKVAFSVNNMGVAFSFAKDVNTESDWRGGTLSITQNRIANFQNIFSFTGNNNQNSIADALVQRANGTNYTDFLSKTGKYANTLEGLAYQSYVINDFNFKTGLPEDASRYFNLLPPDANMRQKGNVNTNGSISQWDVAYGNNYKDKVYIGGGAGIYGLVYNQNRTYSESLQNSTATNVMTNLSLNEQLRVNGTGLNANFGVIVRPLDFIRIGLAFRTPTLLWVSETYNATISANYISSPNATDPPPASISNSNAGQTFSYSVIVPYRANGGISIFFNKFGFLSVDAEYVDYSSATLMQNDNNPTYFGGANNSIKQLASSGAINLRGGLEIRIDMFRLRGGFAYYADPYTSNIDGIDRSTKIFTLGAGIKQENYYFDIAFMRPTFQSGYQPYSVNNMGENPFVTTSNSNTNVSFTVGFNF